MVNDNRESQPSSLSHDWNFASALSSWKYELIAIAWLFGLYYLRLSY